MEELRLIGERLKAFLQTQVLIGLTDENILVYQILDVFNEHVQQVGKSACFIPAGLEVHICPDHQARVNASLCDWETFTGLMQAAASGVGVSFRAGFQLKPFFDPRLLKNEICVYPLIEVSAPEVKITPPGEGSIPQGAFLLVRGGGITYIQSPVVRIGRRLDNHLTLDDPRISRLHAQLEAVDGSYFIRDMDSTGGTFVNGDLVQAALLNPGDVISLAGVPIVYGQDIPEPVPSPSPEPSTDTRPASRESFTNLEPHPCS